MSNTKTQSLTAEEILNRILNAKGQFVKAVWKSNPSPAAAYKKAGIVLEKRTDAVCRAGLNFANLSAVKDAIVANERGEVQELPYGRWKVDNEGKSMFPYVIETDHGDQIRLYPSDTKSKTIYFVNGEEVSKEEFSKYLTPSASAKMYSDDKPLCFNIKKENILGVDDFYEIG